MAAPDSEQAQKSPRRLSRRALIVLGAAGIATGGAVAAQWYNVLAENGGDGVLTPGQAHQGAVSGEIILIDIRRPDEWARTGSGEGALRIDMRRQDFEQVLLEHTNGDQSLPVALICARGVRSRRMTQRLQSAGFRQIIDVPEGMLGSGAGPGWIKRGLPLIKDP